MESLIRSKNFVHNNQNVLLAFQSSVESLISNDRQAIRNGTDDVIKSLKVFGDKITGNSKPVPGTAGWDMAEFTFTKLVQIASQLVLNSSLSKQSTQGFYSFLVRILDNSKMELHLKIALNCLEQSEIQLKEHIQALEAEDLAAFLSVLCRPVTSDEISGQDFGNLYCKLMDTILTKTITPDQVNVVCNQLLDYAVYCYLGCIELPDNVYDKLAKTGENMFIILRNPFSSCEDEQLSRYIRKCMEIIQSKDLSQSKAVLEHIVQFMDRHMMPGLGQQDKFEVLYIDMFDLLMAISKNLFISKGDKYYLDLFSAAVKYFINCTSFSPVDVSVFNNIVDKFIQVVEEMEIRFLDQDGFAHLVIEKALKKLYSNDKQKTVSWLRMLVPLLKRPCLSTMKACVTISMEKGSIKWKEHTDIVKQVLDVFESFHPPPFEMCGSLAELRNYLDFLELIANNFFKGLKKERLTKSYGTEMINLTLKFLSTKYKELFKIAEAIAENIELDALKGKNRMIDAIRRFSQLMETENVLEGTAAGTFFDKVTEPFKYGKVFTDDDFSLFLSICQKLLQQELNSSDDGLPSIHLVFFSKVFLKLADWLDGSNKLEMASPLVPGLLKYLADGDTFVLSMLKLFLHQLAYRSSGPIALAPHVDQMIACFLQCENDALLDVINHVYPKHPIDLAGNFRDLIQMMEDHGDHSLISSLARFFQNVSIKQAELFTSDDIEMLFRKALEDTTSQETILKALQEITKRCPERVIQHVELLPEEMVKELKMQEEKVTRLFGRVDETDEVLFEVKEEVIKQGEQLDEVQADVREQGRMLTDNDTTAGAAAVLMEQMVLVPEVT
ncbi:hypothetical protein Btru_073653 [Bulinus truncatus]|nr:hypothetical protein Btru_073653 [Bulinus truncatus]